MQLQLILNAELAQQLTSAAAIERQSVADYATQLLQNAVKRGSLEQRQFVGQTVSGTAISDENRLVLMRGIYYRYDLLNEAHPTPSAQYEVVGTNGNVLMLRQK